MIVGHGIDIVEIRQIETRLSTDHGEWIDGAFTEDEQIQADTGPNRSQYFAGRYAAKEAAAKALGTGFSDDVTWQDVEILRSATGAPSVRLSDGALEAAAAMGITGWHISISHTESFAIASVIATAE